MNNNLTYEVKLPGRKRKFEELLILIAKKSKSDPRFGVTKLNKLLWLCDSKFFVKHGVPITGVKYQRQQQGTIPSCFLPAKKRLEEAGAIKSETRSFHGKTQKRIIPLRDPDLTYFTEEEIAFIEQIVHRNFEKTASTISAEAHGVAWKVRKDKDIVPYEAAYLIDSKPQRKHIKRTKDLIKKYGDPPGIAA